MKKALLSLFWIFLALHSFVVSDMYVTQEEQIFKSKTLPQDYVFNYSGDYEEVFLTTDSESRIHCLHFKSRAKKGVVLYFHGRGWNLASLYKRAGIPEDFVTRGYDLFIIDYRGFGKSLGPRSENAIFHDANYAYDHLLKTFPEDQITVYGMSFGTGVATQVASNHKPRQLILEAPYTSILDMARRAAPYLPKFITSWVLKYHIRTDQFISKVSCPIHIFHGTHDLLIPYSSSKKLMTRVGKNVQAKLHSIEKGDHNNLPSYQAYSEQLNHLLN